MRGVQLDFMYDEKQQHQQADHFIDPFSQPRLGVYVSQFLFLIHWSFNTVIKFPVYFNPFKREKQGLANLYWQLSPGADIPICTFLHFQLQRSSSRSANVTVIVVLNQLVMLSPCTFLSIVYPCTFLSSLTSYTCTVNWFCEHLYSKLVLCTLVR